MATGYTAAIKDGITFETFLLTCARAFGACITMKEEPLTTPIPDKFEPDTYNSRALTSAKERLNTLKNISIKEAELHAIREYRAAIKEKEEALTARNDLLQKYQDMLVEVKAWQPPSLNHLDLKEFMIKQITDSIAFDCNPTSFYMNGTPQFTGQEWLTRETKKALHNIDYYATEQKKEIAKVEKQNLWLQQLRNSLPSYTGGK